MDKLLGQKLITFDQVTKILPGNTHKNSVRRWADVGIEGHRLESWWVGGKRVTSLEALECFILARSGRETSQCDEEPSESASEVEAEAASEAAARLDELGVR